MKVLHLINAMDTGGAERLLTEMLPIMTHKDIEIDLALLRDSSSVFMDSIKETGINVMVLGNGSYLNPKLLFRLRKLLPQYDVVHVHLFPSLYFAALASIGMKTKLVFTEHSTSNSRMAIPLARPLEKFIYSKYKKIISISDGTQRAIQSWIQSKDERFVVINNGVNLKKFSYQKGTIKPKSLIMVSRFGEQKDQATVIRAMQYLDPSITLRFVGEGINLQKCKQLAKELNLNDRIEFLGTRTDIPELVSTAYIGIQSSLWEGFGLSAVELMASGKPVIASNVDGLKQVVDGAGILFEKGDYKDLAKKITQLIDDKYLYDKTVQACRQRSQQYSIETMTDKIIELYRQLVCDNQ